MATGSIQRIPTEEAAGIEELQLKCVIDSKGDRKFSFLGLTTFNVDLVNFDVNKQFDSRFFSVPLNTAKFKINNIKAYRKMYAVGTFGVGVDPLTTSLESISHIKPFGLDEYLMFGFSNSDLQTAYDSVPPPRNTYNKTRFFAECFNSQHVVLKEFQIYNDYKVYNKIYELQEGENFFNIFLSLEINPTFNGIEGWKDGLLKQMTLFSAMSAVNSVLMRYYIEVDGVIL